MSFDKLLVANRGEIACRVIRTARRLGYRTVAVFSDADAGAPHVQQADEAVRIGTAPAAASYLNIEALIDATRRTGADALHPGYGFLSENAAFAEACAAAGIVFVGPPPAAIRAMGDKARAKRRMLEAGVPCVPGWLGDEQGDDRLRHEAERLGPPLLVKAVAGGGGRGMRLVLEMSGIGEALAGARREAEAAFGNGALMLERLVERGRHIEVQVFCDAHGNAVHLGERDCSTQRRRQKVIEEAPSPAVTAAQREALGRDAVAAALAVGYRGAGTVEFIVDAHPAAQGRHYFLEMNTRLQVEHPVTECVTGLDLVEWQLRIAQGEPLPLAQDAVRFDGHAIEARLYAEDPFDGFKPQAGRVLHWRPEDARIRVDHGIAEGGDVPPHYDAMVAKFVAHGRDRADATRRLQRALHDCPLLGPRNNGVFLQRLLAHPAFGQAAITTATLDDWAAAGHALFERPAAPDEAWQLAAAVLAPRPALRPAALAQPALTLECNGTRRAVAAPGLNLHSHRDHRLRYTFDGVQRQATAVRDGRTLHLALPHAGHFAFTEPQAGGGRDDSAAARHARAPVAGLVARVAVAAGEHVDAGQALVSVDAMKMEMWVQAAAAATVRAVKFAPGDAVAAGAVLVELEPDEP